MNTNDTTIGIVSAIKTRKSHFKGIIRVPSEPMTINRYMNRYFAGKENAPTRIAVYQVFCKMKDQGVLEIRPKAMGAVKIKKKGKSELMFVPVKGAKYVPGVRGRKKKVCACSPIQIQIQQPEQ